MTTRIAQIRTSPFGLTRRTYWLSDPESARQHLKAAVEHALRRTDLDKPQYRIIVQCDTPEELAEVTRA